MAALSGFLVGGMACRILLLLSFALHNVAEDTTTLLHTPPLPPHPTTFHPSYPALPHTPLPPLPTHHTALPTCTHSYSLLPTPTCTTKRDGLGNGFEQQTTLDGPPRSTLP